MRMISNLVRITVRFDYFCSECAKTESVAYLVKEGNDYPKPFVVDRGREDGLEVSPGTHFLRYANGEIICTSCKDERERS